MDSGDIVFEILGYILVPLVMLGTPIIAYRKGRNPLFWFGMAVLLQPIAFLTILLAGKQKKCKFCGKRMDVDLNECPICAAIQDESLPRDPRNLPEPKDEDMF